jgi:hypothetical protein
LQVFRRALLLSRARRAIGIRPNLEEIRARIRRGATYKTSPDRDWVAERRAEWQLAARRAVSI